MSTLWGSYGSSKEWCPSRCPSATAAFDCAGSHRVPFATTVSHGSVAAGFWVVLPGVRARFKAKRGFTWQVQEIGWFWRIDTWVYVAGAKNRTLCENRGRRSFFCGRCQNVGRRVSFEGLRFTWRAQGIRTMDPMFWGRRARFLRGVAFLELELEDQFAWPVQHVVWPRVMISWQAQYLWNMLPFSWKSRRKRHKTLALEVWIFSFRGSLAQNARFGAPDFQFSRKSRTKRSFWSSGFSVFEEVSHKTFLLELRIFSFRGSLAEFARVQDPDASGPKGFSHRDPETEILQKWPYRILIVVALQDPDTEILHKCAYGILILIQVVQRILTQRSWNTDHAQVVPQDPDTVVQKDPDTVVQKDPDTEILHQSSRILTQNGSWYRDLVHMVLQDPWYKWSKRILIQRSYNRSQLKRILIQRSCKSGPTGSWYKSSIGSSYRGPTGSVLQEPENDPDASAQFS